MSQNVLSGKIMSLVTFGFSFNLLSEYIWRTKTVSVYRVHVLLSFEEKWFREKGEGVPFPLFLIPASPYPTFPIFFWILPRTLLSKLMIITINN